MDESPFPAASSSSSNTLRRPVGNALLQHYNLLDESADFINEEAGGSNLIGVELGSQIHPEEHKNGRNEMMIYGKSTGKGKERMSPELEKDEIELGRTARDSIINNKLHGSSVSQHLKEDNGEAEQPGVEKQDLDLAQEQEQLNLSDEQQAEAKQRRIETALIKERDELAQMNTLLEHALLGLEGAIPKIERFSNTLATTHKLLDTYVKVMGQTVHTQRLLLDGKWEMSRDLEEIQAAEELAERARLEEEERIAREKREREERELRERHEAERKSEPYVQPRRIFGIDLVGVLYLLTAALALHPPIRGGGKTLRGRGGNSNGVRGKSGMLEQNAARGAARGTSLAGAAPGTGGTRSIRGI